MINLNDKYKAILENDTRFYIVTGGRGSAKSFSINSLCTLLSFQSGHKILFTRQTMTSAHLSIIPEFQEKIELMGMQDHFTVNKTEIKNNYSDSEITFKGLKTSSGDQTASLKSLQGVTTWILDEAEELTSEKTFDKINLSIRKKGIQNRIILILNPATKEHWIYRKFFEDKGVNEGFNGVKGNTTYINTSYLDNIEHLSQDFIYEAEQMKIKNPTKYKHIMLGGWLNKAEGVIFNNWELGDFKEVSTTVYGQDFGFSIDPTTLVKVNVDKSNKVIYLKECYYLKKLTTSEIYQKNIEHASNALIFADSAEPRLISELKKLGLNIKESTKGAGSIVAGITFLQDYKLIIDPSSTNIIKELNNYVWSDKKSNTPIDNYNHIIDAIRYAVYSYHSKPKPSKIKRRSLLSNY